ncbi:class I SAM-dependent methyltransferase [Anoxybacillus rupiensis]|uniref:Class I SAM-dependent methyltransferase n=1 Tax=Anoxybacteroides rupiense TaxID=311460 RepID=A0ABT5W434_9BACL|nr:MULTISPECIES: class I SAM-dependent methyltransferase [Anoxybacillus]MBS2772371.1 class I SAM-dependent methyltransferase [Anoxybacillus rupiensis]MDE8564076.1 class I SAM-dependent methyltransferase [Anoxybacillus rupiensis]QHC03987.1 class I SAM-dependent methyltransferase [Anoxybacillus sp. PDR2]
MIVTTAGRTNPSMIAKAKQIADELDILYVPRQKMSVEALQMQYGDEVMVVGKKRLEIYPSDGTSSFFFHPNSAMFRVKRVLRGETEPFLEATKLQPGMSFLDCTVGIGSDSIVASTVTGENGIVVGTEGNRYIAYLVQQGLRQWDSGIVQMNEAMRRIQVFHADYLSFLRSLPDHSFDVVYFDPMFEQSIVESDGIQGIKSFALYTELAEEAIFHAKRVARQRVVLKDYWQSTRFHRFGFSVYARKTAKFHFAVIELAEGIEKNKDGDIHGRR